MSDRRLETLDAEGLVLRAPLEGHMRLTLGGGVAWIPDRRPGEEQLRIIRASDGEVLATAWLTDDRAELDSSK